LCELSRLNPDTEKWERDFSGEPAPTYQQALKNAWNEALDDLPDGNDTEALDDLPELPTDDPWSEDDSWL